MAVSVNMIRKHVDQFGVQCDKYLSGLLWAYQNTTHESTGEKPSFLLYGFDRRIPTETALLQPREIQASEDPDYREKIVLSLSHALQIAVISIQVEEGRCK